MDEHGKFPADKKKFRSHGTELFYDKENEKTRRKLLRISLVFVCFLLLM